MGTIYIDRKKHWMASVPFNQYLENLDDPPNLSPPNTACWRGYYGRWKIKGDSGDIRRFCHKKYQLRKSRGGYFQKYIVLENSVWGSYNFPKKLIL
jgi:hypothetical protein